MINKQLPRPPAGSPARECVHCLKRQGNVGQLIHWPYEDCERETVYTGIMRIEPFSMWLFTCRWCRGGETRRKNHQRKLREAWKARAESREARKKEKSHG